MANAMRSRNHEGEHADGSLHSDGAVIQSCFNDFGKHSACSVLGGPQGAAVFECVLEGGGVSSGHHIYPPKLTGLSVE